MTRIFARLGHWWYGSRLYYTTLTGHHPSALNANLQWPWGGSVARGNDIFQGRYDFAETAIFAPNQAPWEVDSVGGRWMKRAHSFDFLYDLSAAGGEAATRQAEALMRSWISHYRLWDSIAWQPEIIAERLISWFHNPHLILASSDLVYRSAVLNAMARQSRHLARVIDSASPGRERLMAIVGLVYSGFCLPQGGRRLIRGLTLLDRILADDLSSDGGYITRKPEDHLEVLKLLHSLKTALRAAQITLPESLLGAIDRLAPMVRMLRHGDGGFASFHGTNSGDGPEIDLILEKVGAKGRPLSHAPEAGYLRVKSGRNLLLLDCGPPPDVQVHKGAHVAPFAFEMSVGKDRMIVNCGSAAPHEEDWHDVCRSTAAHSTLTLGDRNASPLSPLRRRRRAKILECRREENDGKTWITLSHDGYLRRFGLLHERRLVISADGQDVRGEDRISGPKIKRRKGLKYDIRFHLHPHVTASPLQGGTAILLRLPRGGGWQLRADNGAALNLEESVYLGTGDGPRRTEQAVISGALEGEEIVLKWSLTHLESH